MDAESLAILGKVRLGWDVVPPGLMERSSQFLGTHFQVTLSP